MASTYWANSLRCLPAQSSIRFCCWGHEAKLNEKPKVGENQWCWCTEGKTEVLDWPCYTPSIISLSTCILLFYNLVPHCLPVFARISPFVEGCQPVLQGAAAPRQRKSQRGSKVYKFHSSFVMNMPCPHALELFTAVGGDGLPLATHLQLDCSLLSVFN